MDFHLPNGNRPVSRYFPLTGIIPPSDKISGGSLTAARSFFIRRRSRPGARMTSPSWITYSFVAVSSLTTTSRHHFRHNAEGGKMSHAHSVPASTCNSALPSDYVTQGSTGTKCCRHFRRPLLSGRGFRSSRVSAARPRSSRAARSTCPAGG